MDGKKQRLIGWAVTGVVVMLGGVLYLGIYAHQVKHEASNLAAYRAELEADAQEVASQIESTFRQTYQCLRTIARLPGVRELDPYADSGIEFKTGAGIQRDTRRNIQEIYNNLGDNVSISELYIVPINLDPDAPVSGSRSVREPLATFDQLIVNPFAGSEQDDHKNIDDYETEIHEYRLMRSQLKWLKEHYPEESLVISMGYPMISGPQVLTCDCSRCDPNAPDDRARAGIVLSVPYYGPEGELRGCVSAVILSYVLADLIPSGQYLLTNTRHGYHAPNHHDGQWRESFAFASTNRPDPGLLASSIHPLNTPDLSGNWSLWAGVPDSAFWSRSDVQSSTASHYLAYGLVTLVLVTILMILRMTIWKMQAIAEHNVKLEQGVIRRTQELESVIQELNNQKYALDQHSIVSIADVHGNIIYANDKFCELSGYTRHELIGQNHRVVKSDEHDREFYRDLWLTISRGETWHGKIKNRAKDGSHYWVDATIVPFKNEHGKITQYVAVRTDITRQVLNEQRLKETEQRYALAINGSRDGIWDWDLLTDRIYYAPQWKQMLGLSPEHEVTDQPDEWISRIDQRDVGAFMQEFNEHLSGEDEIFEVELRMIHSSGRTVWMLCRGAVVRDEQGKAVRVAGSMADITEIKAVQDKLRRIAEHDRLTGLPNRDLFHKRLQEALDRHAHNPEHKFAVLFFDFDRFKVINDSLGHDVGDALLVSIAERFTGTLRQADTAARFGGDEFVVLLDNLPYFAEAMNIARRLLDAFARPHTLNGHEVTSTASIGLVTNESGYDCPEAILRDADAAMYQAKEAGKARIVVFDQAMHETAVDQLQLEADLREALDNDQFHLVYQPIVSLDAGELHGFEALLRWEHPQRGFVSPARFIPIAEDTGLIVPIGEWVLRKACQQLHQWNTVDRPELPVTVNVNLSMRQVCHPGIVDMIRSAVYDARIDPQYLKLEVTESTIVDDRHDMIPLLNQIKALGIKLAMDDFGTGHSSLGNLHRLPIDVLKIDQSFIKSMSANRELAAVMHAIITLAHELGMQTVAEGIETPEQLVMLQSLDCNFGQGYYFQKPLRTPQATRYLLGLDDTAASA